MVLSTDDQGDLVKFPRDMPKCRLVRLVAMQLLFMTPARSRPLCALVVGLSIEKHIFENVRERNDPLQAILIINNDEPVHS